MNTPKPYYFDCNGKFKLSTWVDYWDMMQWEIQSRLRCSKGRKQAKRETKKQKTREWKGKRPYHELFNVATQRLEVWISEYCVILIFEAFALECETKLWKLLEAEIQVVLIPHINALSYSIQTWTRKTIFLSLLLLELYAVGIFRKLCPATTVCRRISIL